MSLLWLLTSPDSKSAALAVARSVLVGMNDSQEVISFLENSQGNQIKSLSESAPTKEVRALFSRLDYLVQNPS